MRILINDPEHASFDYLENFEKSRKLVGKIITPLVQDYPSTDSSDEKDHKSFVESTLHRQFPAFIEATNRDFRGKRVLDLGCGSIDSVYPFGTHYNPWLCRALLKLGAMPAGIDKNNNAGEKFENYKIDLEESRRDLLSFFPSGSFDIVHSMGLFNSVGVNFNGLKENLAPEIERVLKPEGVFVHDEPYLFKESSPLPYRPRQESYALSGKPLRLFFQ